MENLYVTFKVEVNESEYAYQGQRGEAEMKIQVPRSMLENFDPKPAPAQMKRRDMTDQQTVKALRTEAERLWQIAIEARRAAALAERKYRAALANKLEGLITKCNELVGTETKGEG